MKLIPRQSAPQEAIELVRSLYESGLSTRQIAKQTGFSPSFVHKRCQDITRNKSVAAQLRLPPNSKSWRACRAQARKKVERLLGTTLPRSMVVHHIDEDYTNNSLDNLQVMGAREHSRLHMMGNQHTPKKPFCKNGHNLAVEARDYFRKDRNKWERACRGCSREFMQRKRACQH